MIVLSFEFGFLCVTGSETFMIHAQSRLSDGLKGAKLDTVAADCDYICSLAHLQSIFLTHVTNIASDVASASTLCCFSLCTLCCSFFRAVQTVPRINHSYGLILVFRESRKTNIPPTSSLTAEPHRENCNAALLDVVDENGQLNAVIQKVRWNT
jgi:hypothetical protein